MTLSFKQSFRYASSNTVAVSPCLNAQSSPLLTDFPQLQVQFDQGTWTDVRVYGQPSDVVGQVLYSISAI